MISSYKASTDISGFADDGGFTHNHFEVKMTLLNGCKQYTSVTLYNKDPLQVTRDVKVRMLR